MRIYSHICLNQYITEKRRIERERKKKSKKSEPLKKSSKKPSLGRRKRD